MLYSILKLFFSYFLFKTISCQASTDYYSNHYNNHGNKNHSYYNSYSYQNHNPYKKNEYYKERDSSDLILFEQRVLEKYDHHIKHLEEKIVKELNEKATNIQFHDQYKSNQHNNSDDLFKYELEKYKKRINELYKNPTIDPKLRKELFYHKGEFIEPNEASIILKGIDNFIDNLKTRLEELNKIPYPTARILYNKMSKKSQEEFNAGFNQIIDNKSLRMLEQVSRQINGEFNQNKKEPEYEFSESEIDEIENRVLLCAIRSLINNSIGVSERSKRINNDYKILEYYTKGVFESFSIYSTLNSLKKSLKQKSEEQFRQMVRKYLSEILKEYTDNKEAYISYLDEYNDYMWIKEQEDLKISRPESFKMPKVDNDEDKDFISKITKNLKTKIKGGDGKLGEVDKMQKKAEDAIGGILNNIVSKVQGSIENGLGSITKTK